MPSTRSCQESMQRDTGPHTDSSAIAINHPQCKQRPTHMQNQKQLKYVLVVGLKHTREVVLGAQRIHNNAVIVIRSVIMPESVGLDYHGKYLHRIYTVPVATSQPSTSRAPFPSIKRVIQSQPEMDQESPCPPYDKSLLLTQPRPSLCTSLQPMDHTTHGSCLTPVQIFQQQGYSCYNISMNK